MASFVDRPNTVKLVKTTSSVSTALGGLLLFLALAREGIMNTLFLNLVGIAKRFLTRKDGQGMTEYALLVALISFGCVAGEAAIANTVNHTFITLGTTITAGVEQQ